MGERQDMMQQIGGRFIQNRPSCGSMETYCHCNVAIMISFNIITDRIA